MANQKDRHLESPGEANRDKHINFLAIENEDVDPSSEDAGEENAKESTTVDNGFFSDDTSTLQSKEEYEADKSTLGVKSTPLSPRNTPVKDHDTKPYIHEDDQAH